MTQNHGSDVAFITLNKKSWNMNSSRSAVIFTMRGIWFVHGKARDERGVESSSEPGEWLKEAADKQTTKIKRVRLLKK